MHKLSQKWPNCKYWKLFIYRYHKQQHTLVLTQIQPAPCHLFSIIFQLHLSTFVITFLTALNITQGKTVVVTGSTPKTYVLILIWTIFITFLLLHATAYLSINEYDNTSSFTTRISGHWVNLSTTRESMYIWIAAHLSTNPVAAEIVVWKRDKAQLVFFKMTSSKHFLQ